MNYELAKQLKDVGFPQMSSDGSPLNQPSRYDYRDGEYTFIPTLSELIEACGDDFASLKQIGSYQWESKSLMKPFISVEGKNPDISVANLWLALQPNHEQIVEGLKGAVGIVGK